MSSLSCSLLPPTTHSALINAYSSTSFSASGLAVVPIAPCLDTQTHPRRLELSIFIPPPPIRARVEYRLLYYTRLEFHHRCLDHSSRSVVPLTHHMCGRLTDTQLEPPHVHMDFFATSYRLGNTPKFVSHRAGSEFSPEPRWVWCRSTLDFNHRTCTHIHTVLLGLFCRLNYTLLSVSRLAGSNFPLDPRRMSCPPTPILIYTTPTTPHPRLPPIACPTFVYLGPLDVAVGFSGSICFLRTLAF
ncbi:hypothetical protein M427DRAFT_360113 [Gonapodya prolifera JEL478]|uniref:Uncharacterized protein n=1 Tax=Gonapodya prolifera (strain JEL478) TaxID=1344416 RepID=A0A139AAV6_GONPJ|nr:hypothetical protein M427DRAFT_360113 [Gonapodya prolifera JEL478]|eukprot:KXS13936.1 hypothetical protein M427DRAFT_360113 [Gonapodya prolifera JEL478]